MSLSAETDRFWAKVTKDDCWLWTGGRTRDGYPRFRTVTRWVRAHRYAYELVVGPIPDGLTLDHLCGRKSCVRPAHLEPVTIAENLRRRHERERQMIGADL